MSRPQKSAPQSPASAGPVARIAAQRNQLGDRDLRIAAVIESSPSSVVEMTAQQVADTADVARSSVVRLSQALGYRGYPQLRVALASELATLKAPVDRPDFNDGPLGKIQDEIAHLSKVLPRLTALLDENELAVAVHQLAHAQRLLVLATGLSSPLGLEASLRLTALGRPAEYHPDGLAQQIAALGLSDTDAVLAISASGSTKGTVAAAQSAAKAQATVVAVTSFHDSALTRVSHHSLVLGDDATFRDEIERTSRVSHAIFLEGLVQAIIAELGAEGTAARRRTLEVVSENLTETP